MCLNACCSSARTTKRCFYQNSRVPVASLDRQTKNAEKRGVHKVQARAFETHCPTAWKRARWCTPETHGAFFFYALVCKRGKGGRFSEKAGLKKLLTTLHPGKMHMEKTAKALGRGQPGSCGYDWQRYWQKKSKPWGFGQKSTHTPFLES